MTIDTINALANEQSRIYCQLSRQVHDRGALLRRLHEIQREIASLWDTRRGELAGAYGGIEVAPNNGEAYRRGYVVWHRHTTNRRGG